MRVLIFHGYLLRGTGSNIYNLSLARALASLGHEVHLVCQERHPEGLDLPGAVTIHNPDIGRILPVYVADEYEGFDAVPFSELSEPDLERYLAANVESVAEVARAHRPDIALANHLVMGPAIMRRALRDGVPYAVKVHGSALEYTVRPQPERFLPYAVEGLGGAACVLVGSRHTAESLWQVVGDDGLPSRTRLGPPGVDVHAFRPRTVTEAAAGLERLAERLEGSAAAGWGGEAGAAEALRALDPARDRIVSYLGKLIVSKGVDLLLAAWPLVVARVPDARLCVVGFGTYRDALGQMVEALAAKDLAALREIASRGRELEGGPVGELEHLAAFLDGLEGERREDYRDAAPAAAERVVFTGRLEHGDLPDSASRLRGAGGPQHVPRGIRHGGRGGGRLRRAAALRGALGAGGGLHHSGRGARGRPSGPALVRGGPRCGRGDRGPAGALAHPALRATRAGRRVPGRSGPPDVRLGERGARV